MAQDPESCSGTRDSRLWGWHVVTGFWKKVPVDDDGYLKVNVVATPAGGEDVTIADGADVSLGATTDAVVAGDNTGTVQSRLRYLAKAIADVWDTVTHALKVSIQNATLAVTQSGTWLFGNGLSIPVADYVALTQAATTDTWAFKTGGSGGSTVATITITYTDSTKVTISNVAKT